ncbi:hypothetical protein [Streptomyces sirii]|uniref:hypothetical protein n=1 Tax=Streptomyces sirii TaxID=3127701 RepID=UPI003D360B39
MRNLARAAAVTSAALLALTLATSAQADGMNVTEYAGADWSQTPHEEFGGKATFKPYGANLYITDLVADGHSTTAVLHLPGRDYYYWNKDGAGDSCSSGIQTDA